MDYYGHELIKRQKGIMNAALVHGDGELPFDCLARIYNTVTSRDQMTKSVRGSDWGRYLEANPRFIECFNEMAALGAP